MDDGGHGVRVILVGQVGHVDGVEVGDVVHVLLPCQRGQRVPQGVQPLSDVGIHVNINTAHLPQDVESPGPRTAALCDTYTHTKL